MAISVETLALAKKYTDKTVVSKGDAGAAIIPDNFIDASKLTEDLRKAIDAAGVHIKGTVNSEDGAHALRYFNNTLQYNDGSKWVTLSLSNLLI